MSKIIACRVERCLGCRSCEIACAMEHSTSKTLRGAVRESPRPQRRVTVETAGSHSLPIQCLHCEDAPCVAVCPTGAMHRDEQSGIVRIDEDLCIGCKLCILMCPLGVLSVGEAGRSTIKCDQCIDRQAEGREPACVEACPTHALQLVDADEVRDEDRHLVALNIVAALTEGCGPVASRGATGDTSASEAEREVAGKAIRARAEKIEGAQDRHVVVVGSSAAGAMAAIHAARAGAKVTVITADAVTYRRPAIPALLAGHMEDIGEARIFAPETLQAYGIEVLAHTRATGIDTKAKTITVETADGKTRQVAYDAAVLATGGVPARPPIAGADKAGVCTFLTAEGARTILDHVDAGARRAVIVGASFIALEVAEALLARGLDVSFNVRSRILRRIVEPDLSAHLQRNLERRGLKMLTDEAISEIGGKGKVEYVVHKGEKVPTDLVILGTGVWANAELAEAAGIRLAKSEAVAIDHRMATSAEGIYAAGDCAEVPDFRTGRFTYSPVGSTGALAGAIAGMNAAGADEEIGGFLRAQADEILGLQIYSIGHTTTTAKAVDQEVTVHDLPQPPEVERARDEVVGKLLTDEDDKIVGAQVVARHHGSQYGWQLYRAVLTGEGREDFLAHWTSLRRRAAKAADEARAGEVTIETG